MRTDIKIGILLGIVVVLGAMAYFMLSDGQRADSEQEVSIEPPTPKMEVSPEKKPAGSKDVKKIETRDAVKKVVPVVVIPKPASPKPVVVEKVVPKPVEAPAVPVVKDTGPEVKKPRYYTVKKGDSLYKVAELYYGSGAKANREVIYNANKKIISDPDIINPGWKLRIPYPEEVTE
jgi:nucleoid-associated protein YgaU